MRPSLRNAFSLVELLVVVGIIAVLIGILLPALSKARESAKSVQCAAQLRALGQAFYTYAANSGGRLPTWSGWQNVGGDGSGEDEPGLGWTEKLAPYFAAPLSAAYKCPGFPEDRYINYFISGHWSWARHHRRYLKLGEIKTSADFILSGDCNQRALYPPPYGIVPTKTLDDCDKDDAGRGGPGVVFADEPGGLSVHRGGNNVLFGDGHVTLEPRFDRSHMTYSTTEMKTYDEVTDDGLDGPPDEP